MRCLDVFFGLCQLIVSPEKVDKLGQNWVLVRLIFEHLFELLDGFGVLVFFEQDFSEYGPGLVIFGVDFE